MVLIIDADSIPYRVGFSMAKIGNDWNYAKNAVHRLLKEYTAEAGTKNVIGFLGGKRNFRNDVIKAMPDELKVPSYKGNRISEKPIFHAEIIELLHDTYGFHIIDGIEADDACAIALTQLGDEAILLSGDKDVLQVPGYHIQMRPGSYRHLQVDSIGMLELAENRKKVNGTGARLLWSQMLTGDGVDNFKGVPKCGPVNAVKLLQDVEPELLPKVVYAEYVKAFGKDAAAMFKLTWNLAYLIRYHKNFSIPEPTRIS